VALAAAVGVLTLFTSYGLAAYQLVQDELNAREALDQPPASSEPAPRDISSREADPEPLTVEEVFPEDEIIINPAEPPYQVLATQVEEDCTIAAADALGELLTEHGCNQVVRATMRSPDENYLITGGIFNLATEAGAEEAYDTVGSMIDDESGRFTGMVAGEGTEAIVLSETRVGWDYRGHYLIYVVIARADGEPFADRDDSHAQLILWDIIEVHLRENVLDGRALAPAEAPEPTTTPTAATD